MYLQGCKHFTPAGHGHIDDVYNNASVRTKRRLKFDTFLFRVVVSTETTFFEEGMRFRSVGRNRDATSISRIEGMIPHLLPGLMLQRPFIPCPKHWKNCTPGTMSALYVYQRHALYVHNTKSNSCFHSSVSSPLANLVSDLCELTDRVSGPLDVFFPRGRHHE